MPLFAGLSHVDLSDLCEVFEEVRLSATEELFPRVVLEIERMSLQRRAYTGA